MQVGLHQLLDEIDVFEQLETGRLKDVEDRDNVLMAKVPEKLDLAKGAQTKHGMVERGDTLYGDLPLRWLVDGRASTVRSASILGA